MEAFLYGRYGCPQQVMLAPQLATEPILPLGNSAFHGAPAEGQLLH